MGLSRLGMFNSIFLSVLEEPKGIVRPLVVQLDFSPMQRTCGSGSYGVVRWGMFFGFFSVCLGGFVGAVSIHGVCGVSFLNFNFSSGCPLVVHLGFPLCVESVGSQGVSRLGHVSFSLFSLL